MAATVLNDEIYAIGGFNGAYLTTLDIGSFPPPSIAVAIDIKPGSDPNSINPGSQGNIPVAILSSNAFDASTVAPSTVEFGPNAVGIAHTSAHIEDANEDGLLDLVLHFKTTETGIVCGDTAASLTGATFAGEAIEGSDAVRLVPCK